MAKCGLVGCDKKAVGGFQSIIDAGNFQNPNATIEGGRTLWCEEHESMLNSGPGGGRYLNQKELG
jgi:hypothetical protein